MLINEYMHMYQRISIKIYPSVIKYSYRKSAELGRIGDLTLEHGASRAIGWQPWLLSIFWTSTKAADTSSRLCARATDEKRNAASSRTYYTAYNSCPTTLVAAGSASLQCIRLPTQVDPKQSCKKGKNKFANCY